MINLYFDPKDKVYYYNALNQACDACNKLITDTIIIRVVWDRLGSGINYFCVNCKDALKKSDSASYTDTYNAIIETSIPSKCMPVAFSKPSLVAVRDMSVFDVALKNLDGEKVIDKTVYAGRVEARVPEYVIVEEEHELLTTDELDGFLNSIKSAFPVITYTDKKVLK